MTVPYLLHLAVKTCLVALLVLFLRFLGWAVNLLLIAPFLDPMQRLPGPKAGFLETHLELVMNPAVSPETHKDWRFRFGQTFSFHGFGRHDLRLMSFDDRAISHILNDPAYEKPWQTRSFLGRLIGYGIFSAEGLEHTKQRRIIGPAFSQEAIKRMGPVFVLKAQEILEHWKHLINNPEKSQSLEESQSSPTSAVVDVANWMSRAAFDVIGIAGFNTDFEAVKRESNGVYHAYRSVFNIADKGLGIREILDLYFPILRKIWINNDIKVINESFKIINQSGRKIIAERKEEWKLGGLDEKSDLLSILIESNLSTNSSRRLSDRELLDQCSTFLMAGSDSVSVALSWCFHLLAHHPDIQTRLRNELSVLGNLSTGYVVTSPDDFSSFEKYPCISGYPKCRAKTLEDVEYLDFFVREVLRFCPPVHATIRVAKKDDIIPVSTPVTLSNGDTVIGEGSPVSNIQIRKGTYIHIPIEGMSYSEATWGEDAHEFNPSRWKNLQSWNKTDRPGLLNLMTFGAGSHSCMGHRFTVSEMKVFLAVLVPQLQFFPSPGVEIRKFNSILTRPYVKGKWNEGPQLPVGIRHID